MTSGTASVAKPFEVNQGAAPGRHGGHLRRLQTDQIVGGVSSGRAPLSTHTRSCGWPPTSPPIVTAGAGPCIT
jgi:hypothetical protein